MCDDQAEHNTVELTQEYLAQILGVRRSTVTVVAGTLQHAGLIQYRRGVIKVLDRPGLEAAACECYRIIREGYERSRLGGRLTHVTMAGLHTAELRAFSQGVLEPAGLDRQGRARAMAAASGVSLRSVQRIWAAHGLQPHRVKRFAAKLRDVVGLYLDPPAQSRSVGRREVACVDGPRLAREKWASGMIRLLAVMCPAY